MTTLKNLTDEYDANAIFVKQDGNGCGDNQDMMLSEIDDNLDEIIMTKNGLQWESDWIIKGEGDNPFRIRYIFGDESGGTAEYLIIRDPWNQDRPTEVVIMNDEVTETGNGKHLEMTPDEARQRIIS